MATYVEGTTGGAGNCINDAAYIGAAKSQRNSQLTIATVETAIYVALALWQRNSSESITNMQNEIANRNMKLAEKVHEHAKHFWKVDKLLVDTAFGEAKHVPDYTGFTATMSSLTDKAMRDGKTNWLNDMKEMCHPANKCEAARWDRNAQLIRANAISFADRLSEARTEVLNDMRYSRQYDAVGLGRGLLGSSVAFSNLFVNSGSQAANMLIGSINSGLRRLGYSRRDFTRNSGWTQSQQLARMPFSPTRSVVTGNYSATPTPPSSGDNMGTLGSLAGSVLN